MLVNPSMLRHRCACTQGRGGVVPEPGCLNSKAGGSHLGQVAEPAQAAFPLPLELRKKTKILQLKKRLNFEKLSNVANCN